MTESNVRHLRGTPHVVTPFEIEQRLVELSGLLDQAHEDLRTAEEEYHVAKADFEVKFAKAFVNADERNAEATKQRAVLDTQDEKHRLAKAEAIVRAARANAARLEQQVDITRSVGRLVTSAMNL